METVIHSDGLVDLGYKKHFRVHHGRTNLLEEKPILTALRAFRVSQKPDAQSSVESEKIPVTIILKNVNLGSITGIKISIKSC